MGGVEECGGDEWRRDSVCEEYPEFGFCFYGERVEGFFEKVNAKECKEKWQESEHKWSEQ